MKEVQYISKIMWGWRFTNLAKYFFTSFCLPHQWVDWSITVFPTSLGTLGEIPAKILTQGRPTQKVEGTNGLILMEKSLMNSNFAYLQWKRQHNLCTSPIKDNADIGKKFLLGLESSNWSWTNFIGRQHSRNGYTFHTMSRKCAWAHQIQRLNWRFHG